MALESTTLVDLLIWTYKAQRADTMSGKGLHKGELTADDDERGHHGWRNPIEDCGKLGAIIPGTGHLQRYALHHDAEVVHDAVVAMSATNWQAAHLLRQHGRAGSPPTWGDYQVVERVNDARGHPVVDIAEEVRVNGEWSSVRYCVLAPYPPDYMVEMDRAIYSAWFAGLLDLQGVLGRMAVNGGRKLVRWEVTGLGAEAEPWKGRFPLWETQLGASVDGQERKVLTATPQVSY